MLKFYEEGDRIIQIQPENLQGVSVTEVVSEDGIRYLVRAHTTKGVFSNNYLTLLAADMSVD